jgi:tetratricopeptide (TPR) repeat protein
MDRDINENNVEMIALCNTIKELISEKKYQESKEQIRQAMAKFPHAPEPHNMMGILLEKEGDHLTALKHFRAAWALDPTYLPARYNLNQYANIFCKSRKDAYVDEDCPQEQDKELYKIEYDEKGIGHVIKR